MPSFENLIRNPYETEIKYFKQNPTVTGMATEDNKIILNPFSNLNDQQKNAVALNEYARIVMRTNPEFSPNFNLTEQQNKFLNSNIYKNASDTDRMATIAARLLSDDTSAGTPTLNQLKFVEKLKNFINKD